MDSFITDFVNGVALFGTELMKTANSEIGECIVVLSMLAGALIGYTLKRSEEKENSCRPIGFLAEVKVRNK